MVRNAWKAIALIAVVSFLAACSGNDDGNDVSWLLVLQGTVAETGDTVLTLRTADTGIVFSDRPERQAHLIDLAAFVGTAWSEDGILRTDPPNASLVDESNNTIAVVTVIDAAMTDGMLTLIVEIVEGNLPAVGDEIGLTIDAFPTPVNGQITDAVTQT